MSIIGMAYRRESSTEETLSSLIFTDYPIATATAPEEIAKNMGILNPDRVQGVIYIQFPLLLELYTHQMDVHDEVALGNISNSPQANTTQPAYPVIHQSQTISNRSPTVALSRPHRAWESDYQSPFAQSSPHSLGTLPTDVEIGHPEYATGRSPQFSWLALFTRLLPRFVF